jgi:hypothetical protein
MSDFSVQIMFVVGVVVVAIFANMGCARMASEERAIQAAENIGLRKVVVLDKGMAWGTLGGCSADDVAKFKLRGIDHYGEHRTIEVCAGVPFGGYTVRN